MFTLAVAFQNLLLTLKVSKSVHIFIIDAVKITILVIMSAVRDENLTVQRAYSVTWRSTLYLFSTFSKLFFDISNLLLHVVLDL